MVKKFRLDWDNPLNYVVLEASSLLLTSAIVLNINNIDDLSSLASYEAIDHITFGIGAYTPFQAMRSYKAKLGALVALVESLSLTIHNMPLT